MKATAHTLDLILRKPKPATRKREAPGQEREPTEHHQQAGAGQKQRDETRQDQHATSDRHQHVPERTLQLSCTGCVQVSDV
jgi:hypothetical protein